ncbi:MAG: hypothetical protein IJK72_02975 [Mycoplasma sp.]|nr:hypothetical protein [Mycoplasma sp.]
MHDGKIYTFRLSVPSVQSANYQKHCNLNNKFILNLLKNKKWLYYQYQLCIQLANALENNPIKQKTIKSIIDYLKSLNENINQTIKYLSNSKKSIESIYINSIFKNSNFNDVDGYLRYYRLCIKNNKEYLELLENNNINIINKELPSFNIVNNKMFDAQKLWHDKIDKNYFNSEKVILIDPGFITFLPYEWVKTFKLEKFIGKNTNNQGKDNGPDFLFIDKDNKKVGIEISENAFDNFNVDIRKVKNQDKFIASCFEKSTKFGDFFTSSFIMFVKSIKKIIHSKLNKQYIKTDRLYLVIALKSTQVLNPFRQLCNIVVNNNAKFRKKFNKIIII